MKPRVTYIISNVEKASEFEWAALELKDVLDLDFVFLNPSPKTHLSDYLKNLGIPVHFILYRGKKDLPLAFFKICGLLLKKRPQAVHTHLFDASLAGLTAAFLLRIRQRILTRHHSDFHHQYFKHAVKYDLWCNRMANRIIAVSKNVKNILVQLEHVDPAKITVIYHGLNFDDFVSSPERIAAIRKKYQLDAGSPVIGVVSRFTEWKGIQYIIPAFIELLKSHPQACLVLANANGDYEPKIMALLSAVSPDQYRLIRFENDIASLFKSFDVFVHAPVDETSEAFGQIYIESLACKVPSVFTLSGIASEFIVDKRNALVVDHRNSQQIYAAITLLMQDAALRHALIEQANKDVRQFSFKTKFDELKKIYLS